MELLIAPAMILIVMSIWNFKLEEIVKRALKKHLDKEATKTMAVFLDPRND